MDLELTDATAVLADNRSGTRETAGFLRVGGDRVFSVFHEPAGSPSGVCLVCSPVLAEHLANYRREVLLARELADAGIAVRRFHFRGTGHSDGRPEDLSFERMAEDATMVLDRLLVETGAARVAFVGTRLSAIVAASLASSFPGGPLALWEPALVGGDVFREMFRAVRIRRVKDASKTTPADPVAEVEERGVTDVLGYPLGRDFFRSMRDRRLLDELGQRARSLLIVRMSKRAMRRPADDEAELALRHGGFIVERSLVPKDVSWWFPEVRMPLIKPVVDRTVPWLVGALA